MSAPLRSFSVSPWALARSLMHMVRSVLMRVCIGICAGACGPVHVHHDMGVHSRRPLRTCSHVHGVCVFGVAGFARVRVTGLAQSRLYLRSLTAEPI